MPINDCATLTFALAETNAMQVLQWNDTTADSWCCAKIPFVTCSPSGVIVGLELHGLGIIGPVHTSIALLIDIEILNLAQNNALGLSLEYLADMTQMNTLPR